MHPEQLQSVESQEQIKSRLQERYQGIIGKQLTPGDIDTFAEDIIAELMTLTEEVTKAYAKESGLDLEEYKGKDFEDEAFLHYELERVSDLLEKAQEKLEIVREVSGFVAQNINIVHLEEVITPTEKESNSLQPGNGEEFAPDMIPRLTTALYILREGGVPLENITLMDGIVTPDMLRQTSYVTVVVPEIDRLMSVCDEEGNASYIFKLSLVNVETINRMTKPEKNDLIASQPGIGVRFNQGPRWRERVESFLFEEIPAPNQKEEVIEQTPEQEVLTPSYGEFDPWRGFAVDEQGRHWGIRFTITKKIGRSYTILDNRIHNPRIETRPILNALSQIKPSYCYEQLLALFPEMLADRQVEREGEWEGFWMNPETGKHWSTGLGIQNKFGIKDWVTVKRYVVKYALPSTSINDLTGRRAEAYCYEDFLALEPFMEFVTAPQVELKGKWAGYWVDKSGKHWAPLGVLAHSLQAVFSTIERIIEEAMLPKMILRARTGTVSTAYSIEDLEESNQYKEFVNAPLVEKEGEWEGFLTDNNGKHWGNLDRIAEKLNAVRTTTRRLAAKHPELPSKTIKNLRGKPHQGFCYEDIQEVMNSKK